MQQIGTFVSNTEKLRQGPRIVPYMINKLVTLVTEADGVGVPLDLQPGHLGAFLGEGLHYLVHMNPGLHLEEPSIGGA